MSAMLEVRNVSKSYGGKRLFGGSPVVHALSDVSLTIAAGESFGLVGESGSGKSTLTRCILGLEKPDSGTIAIDGVDLGTASAKELRDLRARVQIVFQDPYASLNPRMKIRDIVAEPLVIHADRFRMSRAAQTDRVVELLERVGLSRGHIERYPHEFSGGQRQRIAIARALASEPQFLVLDEPTSALDVSVQAQVLKLLLELQAGMKLTYLFVSHDLGAVRFACDHVAVLNRGRLVETGNAQDVLSHPSDAYTRALVAAVPDIDPRRSLAARIG